MSSAERIARINEILKREIADVIEKKQFMDGMSCLISITGVKASQDLRHADVYVSIFGGDGKVRRAALDFLNKNRADIQASISKDVPIKYTPVLKFFVDKKVEEGDRVLNLIEEMERDEKDHSG